MRRAISVFASLGLGFGTVVVATPAQAATTETVVVTEYNENLLQLLPSFVTASQVTFHNQTASNITLSSPTFSSGGQPCAPCVVDANDEATFTVAPSANNALVTVQQVGTSRDQGLIVTYVAPSPNPAPGSGSTSATASAPASEIQQFGLPASGNCEDGVNEAINWSGIGMDGWGISWAQWMNEGAGGAVCTRTVMYDTSTAKWTVS